MTAAENRRRIAEARAVADSWREKPVAFADSAELIYAARLFPRVGAPCPVGGSGAPKRLIFGAGS